MDIVYIRDLKIQAVIGVLDWERAIRQPLSLELEMACDISKSAASDDIADALDYAAVSARVETCLQALRPQLLEHGAEVLAKALQDEFGITWLRLAIRKPGAVPTAQAVGVQIERGVR